LIFALCGTVKAATGAQRSVQEGGMKHKAKEQMVEIKDREGQVVIGRVPKVHLGPEPEWQSPDDIKRHGRITISRNEKGRITGICRTLPPDDPRSLDHPSHKEKWIELARALGRDMADHDFKRMQEWQRQHNDEPAPDTTACASCGLQEPATELMRLWTGEKIVRQYWHVKCFKEASEKAWGI
jgi:hypothetical protein